jgi:hypothetical protein
VFLEKEDLRRISLRCMNDAKWSGKGSFFTRELHGISTFHMEVPEVAKGHSQNGLQAESVEVSIVFIGWVRRAVQRPRKNNAKVNRWRVGLRLG